MATHRGNRSTPCPVCGGEASTFITIDTYETFRCSSCGHGFVHPLPSPEELARAYNTADSSACNSNAFALLDAYLKDPATVHRHFARMIKRIKGILPLTGNSAPSILEVGCSTGVLLRCLRDNGYENVTGIEINPVAAAAGTEKLGIRTHVAAMEDFKSSKKFDLIIACAVIEHAREPVAALRGFAQLLNDKGVIYFVVPNFNGAVRFMMGRKWLWHMPPYHLHHFTEKSMRIALESAGLAAGRLATENTGTNAYLLHYAIFGAAKTEGFEPSNPQIYKIADVFDTLSEAMFFPIIRPLRRAGLGAHITGVAHMK